MNFTLILCKSKYLFNSPNPCFLLLLPWFIPHALCLCLLCTLDRYWEKICGFIHLHNLSATIPLQDLSVFCNPVGLLNNFAAFEFVSLKKKTLFFNWNFFTNINIKSLSGLLNWNKGVCVYWKEIRDEWEVVAKYLCTPKANNVHLEL